ncbi:C-type lectin domain family 1 member A-like [Phascolarctos cinereus]|uniref:C-type lectin domain family 1 member A-like n=1 Tax=Phascolarctos cinereus TaxID=38626 RepID=A0A6P5LNB6_PHACI|nr:C-type lectin domain family 1 member A-like [Phascolarctos cinereus]XP_020857396.1 C-type lectin domain family 1 member A-like [Phascolarctos cinereus]
MQAEYNSTLDMLDDDGETTLSLRSQALTIAQTPESKDTGYPTTSPSWRPVALILLTLCLVLLIGLGVLGLEFFQLSQLSITQRDILTQKEESLGNLSRQLHSLQAQNRKLTDTLQHLAKKLCRELYNKTGEHRCSPCPKKWKWHKDSCYCFSKESNTWQGCEHFCTAENSTLLKIETQDVLEFVMPQSYSQFFYSYWTGLSRNGSGNPWLWMDGSLHSFDLFDIAIDFSSLRSWDCVTILNGRAFSKDCKELRRCACQRTAAMVMPEWLE